MTISLTSPVTGSAQTGLTGPTYTLVLDTAPNNAGKQWAVTAIGGTQTGVLAHTVASPFTVMFERPSVLKMLGAPAANGFISNVPTNRYKCIVRKGVVPAVNQPARPLIVRVEIDVPAGADTYDAASVRAALSLAIGALSQQSAGFGDTSVSGLI